MFVITSKLDFILNDYICCNRIKVMKDYNNKNSMKLSEIGEFGIIEKIIAPNFNKLLGQKQEGIGDDCAIMQLDDKQYQIVTTDLLIEGTHFIRDKISPFDLGFKSLAVNLSDIASMGGIPVATFLSVGFPSDLDVSWVDDFVKGYRNLSEKEAVPLMGGDTTKSSSQIVINVAVIGRVEKDNVKRRSSAKIGDLICATNMLGDSAAGLRCVQNSILDAEYLIGKHNKPIPRVSEGRFLSQYKEVHAMMDVSDGIFSDIHRIMKLSGVGARIYCDKIPVSNELISICKDNCWDINSFSVAGGEDYELLFTVDRDFFPILQKKYQDAFHTELVAFGEIVQDKQKVMYFDGDEEIDIKSGFKHFK